MLHGSYQIRLIGSPARSRNGACALSGIATGAGVRKIPDNASGVSGMMPNTKQSDGSGIIGTVLKGNDAFDEVELLEPRHFYDPLRASIWAAIGDKQGAYY